MTSIIWFRRDLRTRDQPLFECAPPDQPAIGLFIVQPDMLRACGPIRTWALASALKDLSDQLHGKLVIVRGDSTTIIPALLQDDSVTLYSQREFSPLATARDAALLEVLGASARRWITAGSPYAVDPGSIVSGNKTPYKVFTPFSRVWREHGWPQPAPTGPDTLSFIDAVNIADRVGVHEFYQAALAALPSGFDPQLAPPIGETAAVQRWQEWTQRGGLTGYSDNRNIPALDATSKLSAALKWGTVHPRTLLAALPQLVDAKLAGAEDARVFANEIAWRDFYADVLAHNPHSRTQNFAPAFDHLPVEHDRAAFALWCEGRTGFPIVDAAMRQLNTTGWMHNRLRMITASFLTKDLHLPWQWGARYFMQRLVDGDIASNQHGWQWTAGTGTDASPFFRVFNPTGQGEKFDPQGEFVRAWVSELAHVPGKAVHQPGVTAPHYQEPMVDHAQERVDALRRLEVVKAHRAG